jgi:hypothetical protein
MIFDPFLRVLNINIEAKIRVPNFMHKNDIINPLPKELKILKIEIKSDTGLKLDKLNCFGHFLKINLLSIPHLNIMRIKNNSIGLALAHNKQRLIPHPPDQPTKRLLPHQPHQMIQVFGFNCVGWALLGLADVG